MSLRINDVSVVMGASARWVFLVGDDHAALYVLPKGLLIASTSPRVSRHGTGGPKNTDTLTLHTARQTRHRIIVESRRVSQERRCCFDGISEGDGSRRASECGAIRL